MRRATTISLAMGWLCIASYALAAGPNAQTRAMMDRTLPAINFANVSLKDAIEFMRDVSGANIHPNWKAIEAAGVTQDTQINLRLRQVSLRKVLNMVLSEASGGGTLSWYIEDGVIEITTKEQADSIMYLIIYPVEDLLIEPPDLENIPDFGGLMNSNSGGSNNNNSGGYGGNSGGYGGNSGSSGSRRANNSLLNGNNGGGGGGGMFGGGGGGGGNGGWGGGGGNKKGKDGKDAKSKDEELIKIIQDTITPSIWVENGGKASIKFFNGSLIVNAPRSVHEQLGGPID